MFALDPTPAERFKQVLRQLSSSRESIQQATKILMDNVGDSEELFSILMKRLRKMSAKRRLPLFYLVDSVCQISKSKQHAEYRELTAKYLIEILQLVVPDEGEARTKAFPTVHKVLGLWKDRKVFGLELLKRARRKIEPTDKGFEDPTIRRDRSFCTDKSTEEIMKHIEEWRRNEKRNRWESALRPVNDKPNAEFEEAWEKFHQQEILPPRPLDPHDHRRVPIRRGLVPPGASVSSDPSEIDLPIKGMEPNHIYMGETEYVRHPDGFPTMANSSDHVHVSIDGVVDMDTSHSLVTRGPAPLLQPPQPNQPPKMYRSPSSRSGSPSGSPQSFPPFPFQPPSSQDRNEFTPPMDSPNLIGSNGMVGTSGMVNLAGSSGGMGASMDSMMVDNNGMGMDMRMGMEGQDQGNFQQGNFNQNSQFEGGSLGGSMDGMNMMPMMNPNMMNNMGMGNMGPMAMNPMNMNMSMNNNMGNMNGIGMGNMNNQMGMNMNMGMNMGMNMMGNGMMNPMGMNMMNNMGMNGMGMNGMGMNGMQMGMNNMMGMGMMNNNGNNMYNNTNNNNMYGFNSSNNNSQQEGFYQPTTDESPSSTAPTPNQTPKPLPPSSKPSPATSPTNTTPSPTVAKPTPGTPKIAGKPPAIPGKPAAAVVKKPAPVVTAKPPVQKLKAAPLDKPTDDKSPHQSPHTSPRQSPHSSPPLNKPPQPQGAPSKPLPPLSKIPPSPSVPKPFAAKAKPSLSKPPPFYKPPAPTKPAASPVASPSPSSSPSPSPSAKPAPTRPIPQELKQAPHEFKIAPKPQLNTINSASNNNPGSLIPDPLQSSSPNTNYNNNNNNNINNNNNNSNNNSNTVSNSSQGPPTRQDAIQTVDMSISPSSSPNSSLTLSNPSTLNPGDQQSQENKSLTTSNALT